MRILCICYEYPPIGGGGATVCCQLNEALVAAGHVVHIVTSGMRDLPAESVENGVHVHRVRCIRRNRHYSNELELLSQLLPTYRRARRLIGEVDFDLIHCHFVVPSGLVARWLGRATGLPYVITAHGSDIPSFNPDRFDLAHKLIAPAWRRVLNDASQITVSSKFLRGLIADRIDVPVEIIPNGLELPEPDPEPKNRRNRILVASRVVKRKGIQDLIRAAAHSKIDWEICIAGDGPYLDTVREIAEKFQLNPRFLGFIDREELQSYYNTAKVFVFPSHQENFPMVLIEAMASGCAVITTTADGCVEVARDGALFYDPGDTAALSELLRRVANDPELVERMQRKAREAVSGFDINVIAREFMRTFTAVKKTDGR